MSLPITISVAEGGVRNTRCELREFESFAELVATWKRPARIESIQEKETLPYFVGGVLTGKRRDEKVESRTLLTLDVEAKDEDSQPPAPEKVFTALKASGLAGWIYTTASHCVDAPRYRIVVPLAEPIAGEGKASDLKAATRRAAELFGVQEWCQPESWVLSQPMYVPAQLVGAAPPYSKVTSGTAFAITRDGSRESLGQARAEIVLADIPDRRIDPVLHALKAAGLYLGEDKRHAGKHFFRCPHAHEHGTSNDTQTAYWEAHFNGKPKPAVHCLDTALDEVGKRHLTYRGLVSWLRNEGHLAKTEEDEDTAEVFEEPESFMANSAVGGMLDTDAEPLEFAIAGFAPLGMVTVLAGPGGVSKSSLALRLLLAASTGCPFGPFRVKQPMRCLYVSYEDDRRTFHSRLRSMYDALADSVEGVLYDIEQIRRNVHIAAVAEDAESWVLMRKAERYGTPTATERTSWLAKILRRFRIRLLVLDPAAFTHRLEENDPSEMAAYMQMLGALAGQADCAIVLLHHMQKAAAWMALDDVNQGSLRGASSLADNARSVAVMMSVSKKDASKFGLPDTDETVSTYAVLKHVKHNHSASLGVHVFQRCGALLVPRPEVRRLPDHEVDELRASAQALRRANKRDVRALKAVEYLLAYDNEPRGTNQIRMDVFGGDSQTSTILKHGENAGWLENLGTGQRHEWAATVDGKEAVRVSSGKPSKQPSR